MFCTFTLWWLRGVNRHICPSNIFKQLSIIRRSTTSHKYHSYWCLKKCVYYSQKQDNVFRDNRITCTRERTTIFSEVNVALCVISTFLETGWYYRYIHHVSSQASRTVTGSAEWYTGFVSLCCSEQIERLVKLLQSLSRDMIKITHQSSDLSSNPECGACPLWWFGWRHGVYDHSSTTTDHSHGEFGSFV